MTSTWQIRITPLMNDVCSPTSSDHDPQHNVGDLCENVMEVCSRKRAPRVARVYLPGHGVLNTQFLLSGLERLARLHGRLHRRRCRLLPLLPLLLSLALAVARVVALLLVAPIFLPKITVTAGTALMVTVTAAAAVSAARAAGTALAAPAPIAAPASGMAPAAAAAAAAAAMGRPCRAAAGAAWRWR